MRATAPRFASSSAASSRAVAACKPISARTPLVSSRQQICRPTRAIEIDFSDPDAQLGLAGCILGLVAGIGAPIWYINRVEADNERLEELRALNRATYEATGEYMNDDEIAKIRKPKWTDRREFVDDD